MDTLYAEDIGHFWKTSKAGADKWIDKTLKLIIQHGGTPLQSLSGMDLAKGRSAFMISFEMGGDTFKITWPVLPSKRGDNQAARVQSATMLHHTIKSRLLEAKIRGPRAALFSFLALPSGKVAGDLAVENIEEYTEIFRAPQLTTGDEIIDGSFEDQSE